VNPASEAKVVVLMRRNALKHREGRLAEFPFSTAARLVESGAAAWPKVVS